MNESLIQEIRMAYEDVQMAYQAVEKEKSSQPTPLDELLAYRVLRLHSGLVKIPNRYTSRLPERFWQHFRAIRRILAHDIQIQLLDIRESVKSFVLPSKPKIEAILSAWEFDEAKYDLPEWQAVQPHHDEGKPVMEKEILEDLNHIQEATLSDQEIDQETLKAMTLHAPSIHTLRPEQYRSFLNEILVSDHLRKGFYLLHFSGYLKEILPEVDRTFGWDQRATNHKEFLFDHLLSVAEGTPSELKVRMAGLFHDVGKMETRQDDPKGGGSIFYGHPKVSSDYAIKRLTALAYPPKFVEKVSLMIYHHMDNSNVYTEKAIRRLLRALGEKDLSSLFSLQRSDMIAANHPDLHNIEDGEKLVKVIKQKEEEEKKKVPFPINGRDLIALGFKPGKILGQVLEEIKIKAENGELPLEKEKLLEYAKTKLE